MCIDVLYMYLCNVSTCISWFYKTVNHTYMYVYIYIHVYVYIIMCIIPPYKKCVDGQFCLSQKTYVQCVTSNFMIRTFIYIVKEAYCTGYCSTLMVCFDCSTGQTAFELSFNHGVVMMKMRLCMAQSEWHVLGNCLTRKCL